MIVNVYRRTTLSPAIARPRALMSLAVFLPALLLGMTAREEALACPECKGAFARSLEQAMERMDRDMGAAPMVGDPDRDFAAMMIPHHQGAIAMAQAEIRYGKDPVMRRLAQEILVTQVAEIDVMRRRTDALPRSGVGRARRSTPAPVPAPRHREVPATKAAVPISAGDRVYAADQTSNTVSVIKPSTNRLLGVLPLGAPSPTALSPLYKGALLVHGLGYSPDHRTLAVVSIGSNSVTLVDTATNRVKGVIYVGRSPHEAFFTPDGRELWVAIRGEDYVSVIDPSLLKEVRRVPTANGPGMVLFRPDGRYAFVPSSFTPELDVIDVARHEVVARVKQASPFSPNLAVSPDGKEVWFTLKDTGKVQVIGAEPPFATLATLDTGPVTNHVAMVDNAAGHFAYVTVGGLDQVKVYRRDGAAPRLVTTIPTGPLPHGIWPSGDATRVYVGLENADQVQAIDTLARRVVATIPIGQSPQAVVYVPGAAPSGIANEGLKPLQEASPALVLRLSPPGSATTTAKGTVVVRTIGLVDQLQLSLSGLEPGRAYDLVLADDPTPPYGSVRVLATFRSETDGRATGQALGPIRRAFTGKADAAGEDAGGRKALLVLPSGEARSRPILVEMGRESVVPKLGSKTKG
jgi:YVTN family beta-propeller protein